MLHRHCAHSPVHDQSRTASSRHSSDRRFQFSHKRCLPRRHPAWQKAHVELIAKTSGDDRDRIRRLLNHLTGGKKIARVKMPGGEMILMPHPEGKDITRKDAEDGCKLFIPSVLFFSGAEDTVRTEPEIQTLCTNLQTLYTSQPAAPIEDDRQRCSPDLADESLEYDEYMRKLDPGKSCHDLSARR